MWMHPAMTEYHVLGLGRCDLYLDFVSIVIVSGVYLLYYLGFSFDFIIYVPSTIFFSYFGTGLPG